jgi:hypothetical protein
MSALSKKLNASFMDYESLGTKQTISLTVELRGNVDLEGLRKNISQLKLQFKDIYFDPVFEVIPAEASLKNVEEIFSRGQKVPLEFHLVGKDEHYFFVGLYHHSFCDGLGGLEVFRRIVEPGGEANFLREEEAVKLFELEEKETFSLKEGLKIGAKYIRAKAERVGAETSLDPKRKVVVVSRPIKEVKNLKNKLGCTLNELYLFGVSQILKDFYPDGSNRTVLVPVNLRPRGLRTTVEVPLESEFNLSKYQEISRQLGSKENLNAYRSARSFVLMLPRFVRIPTFGKLARATTCIATYVPDGVTKRELCGARIVSEFGMPALLPGHELGFCLITTRDEFSVGITLAGSLLNRGEEAKTSFARAFAL